MKYGLTLILLTWRIWWAPINASKWQMGFNSMFKGLIHLPKEKKNERMSIALNKIMLFYMKQPTWCNPQSPIEVFSHTRLTLLRMFYYVASSFDLECTSSWRHWTRTWTRKDTKYREVGDLPRYIKNSLHCIVIKQIFRSFTLIILGRHSHT